MYYIPTIYTGPKAETERRTLWLKPNEQREMEEMRSERLAGAKETDEILYRD